MLHYLRESLFLAFVREISGERSSLSRALRKLSFISVPSYLALQLSPWTPKLSCAFAPVEALFYRLLEVEFAIGAATSAGGLIDNYCCSVASAD